VAYDDDQGHFRTDSGQFGSGFMQANVVGSTAEQLRANVGHVDSLATAQAKVHSMRSAAGLDPFTGRPRTPLNYMGPTRTGRVVKWLFLFWLLLMAGTIAYSAWKTSSWRQEYRTATHVVEAWGLKKSIGDERIAGVAVYEKYASKGWATYDIPPLELNEKAKQLLAGDMRVLDKAIGYWGPAAWKCLSENPNCLQQAGVLDKGGRDIRRLGLEFLEFARKRGSPDAAADIGLYLLYEGTTNGPATKLALRIWSEGVKENPEAIRAKRLLELARDSQWPAFSSTAAGLMRALL
jgi:hypothetical protein